MPRVAMQASSSTPPLRPKAKLMAQTAGDSPHCICASLSVNSPSNSPFRLNSPAQLAASPLAIRVALTAVTPPPAAASPVPIEPRSASCPPAMKFLPPAVRRLQEEQRTSTTRRRRAPSRRPARRRSRRGSSSARRPSRPRRRAKTTRCLLLRAERGPSLDHVSPGRRGELPPRCPPPRVNYSAAEVARLVLCRGE